MGHDSGISPEASSPTALTLRFSFQASPWTEILGCPSRSASRCQSAKDQPAIGLFLGRLRGRLLHHKAHLLDLARLEHRPRAAAHLPVAVFVAQSRLQLQPDALELDGVLAAVLQLRLENPPPPASGARRQCARLVRTIMEALQMNW